MIEGKNRIGQKREVKWKPKAIKRRRVTRYTSRKTTQPSTAAQPSTATFDGGEATKTGNFDGGWISVVIEYRWCLWSECEARDWMGFKRNENSSVYCSKQL